MAKNCIFKVDLLFPVPTKTPCWRVRRKIGDWLWLRLLAQDVSVRDGLSDDGAVIRACKDFLNGSACDAPAAASSAPSETASDPGSRETSRKPRWGLCVLRAYQRLCSQALRAPTSRLYAFNHRPRKFLAAEAQLREKLQREGDAFPACSDCSPPGKDSDRPSVDGVTEDLEDDTCCENCLVRCSPRSGDIDAVQQATCKRHQDLACGAVMEVFPCVDGARSPHSCMPYFFVSFHHSFLRYALQEDPTISCCLRGTPHPVISVRLSHPCKCDSNDQNCFSFPCLWSSDQRMAKV